MKVFKVEFEGKYGQFVEKVFRDMDAAVDLCQRIVGAEMFEMEVAI
jgi:hypothetical protein